MMQHILSPLLIALVSFGLFAQAQSAPRYKYGELQIKDYDEMLTMVKVHTKAANKILRQTTEGEQPEPKVVEELRTALQLMLSRPNQDNMLAKLLPEVRKELANLSAFDDSLAGIVVEAIEGLNNEKLPTVYRVTSHFILENVLSEFKPEIRDKEDLRKIFENIRDAKIKVPEEVKKELKLRSMFKAESPSERAGRIVAEWNKQNEKKNEKKKK